jgi:hypothetical protein
MENQIEDKRDFKRDAPTLSQAFTSTINAPQAMDKELSRADRIAQAAARLSNN